MLCAAALAVGACDFGGSSGAQVKPKDVSAAALKEAADGDEVRRFYELVQWQAVWDRKSASQLLDALAEAPRHALTQRMFLPDGGPDEPAAREAALTKAALGYARALAMGQTDPKKLWPVYTLPRPKTDVAAGLAQALKTRTVGEWLASLPPQTAEYKAMSDALIRFTRESQRAGNSQIEAGKLIHQGDSDLRVPRLVEALRANGYLQQLPEDGQDANAYTAEIAAGVRRMQQDFGLKDDGVIGRETLEVLNTGAHDRARQLAVNLERLRWLDRNPPATRIDVNTASAILDYWRDGQHRDRRRVVVGQPDWETPQLGSPVFQLVAHPNWVVPDSIAEEEIAEKSQAWLRQNDFAMKDGRYVQQPGPKNALGAVKLAMKNDQAIYLHDTPAKQLFARSERHESHGCIRIEGAVDFARALAAADGVLAEFDKAMASDKEKYVELKTQVPVRLMYRTAFLDGGKLVFRTDAYGWDDVVARALGQQVRAARRVQSHFRDIGP